MKAYFINFNDFISMDGHGVYVWTAWLITFTVVLTVIMFSRMQRKHTIQSIQSLTNRQANMAKKSLNQQDKHSS